MKLSLAVITGLATSLLLDLFTAWLVMLMLGIEHESLAWVPALGYWQTFGLVFIATTVISAGTNRVAQAVSR